MPDSLYRNTFVLLAALLAQAASAELAIIVRSNLSGDEPYHQTLLDDIGSETRRAFESMSPEVYGNDERPEGKPAYVLLVHHSGRISVGTGPRKASNGYKVLEAGVDGRHFRRTEDRGTWSTIWTLPASQTHRVTYTFKKLQAGNYRTVHKWSLKLPEGSSWAAGNGQVIVASLRQSTADDFHRNPPCPVTYAEAREVALKRTAPDSFEKEILAGLLKAQAHRPYEARAARKRADTPWFRSTKMIAPLSLKNESPLPLLAITVNVNFDLRGETRSYGALLVTHEFDPPLAASKSMRLELQGDSKRAHGRRQGRGTDLRIINARFGSLE